VKYDQEEEFVVFIFIVSHRKHSRGNIMVVKD